MCSALNVANKAGAQATVSRQALNVFGSVEPVMRGKDIVARSAIQKASHNLHQSRWDSARDCDFEILGIGRVKQKPASRRQHSVDFAQNALRILYVFHHHVRRYKRKRLVGKR